MSLFDTVKSWPFETLCDVQKYLCSIAGKKLEQGEYAVSERELMYFPVFKKNGNYYIKATVLLDGRVNGQSSSVLAKTLAVYENNKE
ncbi:hypothetical protein OUZ56_004017 [Daphnia magna]|uniref:Uncharacterized protein n=1 Tax=Daphnia magna TaxID=35525 RepID=A0ABQ9YNP6_9CRUS|nr:hypothetical protein OUZ56_004017 [Daphnia magna]